MGRVAIDNARALPALTVASKSAIEAKYRELANVLGDATSDIVQEGTGLDIKLVQTFEHGLIASVSFSGTHAVYGAIYQKYVALGREKGFLGYPTTDEASTLDGIGRFSRFRGGSIFWTPDTGAQEVHGAILRKWKSLNWERGFLGYPVTDETSTPDGIGRFNHFQGGSIFWTPETGAQEVHGAIRAKWESLGWERSFLGYPVTDETSTLDGTGRFNHFQGGSIFWTPQSGANEIHGAIREKWESLGWERSWLGYPTTDEQPFTEEGRVSVFERGSIYWWQDVGAVELNDVRVHYTGLICFGETDWDGGSDSDEPYVILGIIAPTGNSTIQSQVYQDVDGGESRPDLLELYRGKPYGINITAVLMEHDEGNPDKYKAEVSAAVGAAAAGATAGVALIPVVGPFLAPVFGPALAAAVPAIADELNNLLDFGDNKIGYTTLNITAKQMVVLAARTGNSVERGVSFKLATGLLSGEGASYKVYFGLAPA